MNYSDFSKTEMECIAETQGDIFAYAKKNGCNIVPFIEKYMNSKFCNQEMDSVYSYFHCKTAGFCFSYINSELHLEKGESKSDISDPYWVGAVYRYLVFLSGMPSSQVIKFVSPTRLDDLSVAYECQSVEEAARDIYDKIRGEEIQDHVL